MGKILIVEDDSAIIRLLEMVFLGSYNIISTAYGNDTTALIDQHAPILIILDIGLPDSNGMDIISRIRETTQVPIIMLSGRSSDLEKITSFNFGADDFIVKPFSVAELQARVQLAIRHYNMIYQMNPHSEGHSNEKIMTNAVFRIELDQQRIFINEHELTLTNKEFILLKLFCDMNNKVLTREYILDRVWGINNLEIDTRAVDACVSRIRKKLRVSLNDDIIKAISGSGYRMSIS